MPTTFRRPAYRRFRRRHAASAPLKKQISKSVKRTLSRQVEKKYFSDNAWATPKEPDSTGAMYALNTIVAGTGVQNRIGDKINLIRGLLNVRVVKHVTATSTQLVGMILYDKEYNAQGINTGVVLDGTGRVEAQPIIRIKENIKNRFVVLKRFTMLVDANRPSACKFMSYKIGRKQLFDASGPFNGLIHLLLMTNEDEYMPYVYYDTRIFFTDS